MPRIAAVLLLLLAACSGDDPDASPSPSPADGKPPVATLLAFNVVLSAGRDRPAVFGIEAATPGATVIVNHDPRAHLDVYLLESAGASLPAQECPVASVRRDRSCVRDIGTGVRETLERPGRGGAIALVLRSGPGRTDVRIEYGERSRAVSMRLPSLAAPPGASVCKDNGCNPFLEMMPLRTGTMKASASFGSGTARLQVQSGRIIAKSFTATGIPYRITGEDSGRSPLSVESHIDTPGEYALAFLNIDPANPVTGIDVTATWP